MCRAMFTVLTVGTSCTVWQPRCTYGTCIFCSRAQRPTPHPTVARSKVVRSDEQLLTEGTVLADLSRAQGAVWRTFRNDLHGSRKYCTCSRHVWILRARSTKAVGSTSSELISCCQILYYMICDWLYLELLTNYSVALISLESFYRISRTPVSSNKKYKQGPFWWALLTNFPHRYLTQTKIPFPRSTSVDFKVRTTNFYHH